MRKFSLTIALFLFTFKAFAGEGMWLPFLLQQLNEKEMQAMGMKIKAEDIYSVNKGSLKDAVVIFGGGCTGEVVSNQGLVLTNHHCGYGTVNGLSSVKNDYLTDGFFAKSQANEIPCPGLSVRFIRSIEPVTDAVEKGTSRDFDKKTNDSIIAANIEAIVEGRKRISDFNNKVKSLDQNVPAESSLEYQVKGFFYNNEYYLFTIERFTDVRLVGFPPNGIGKFGGDTDNWAWPRHTGDFGLFRIYANENNEAADYNENNKPYKPRKHLKINIGGLEEGDFAMVYGFPGSTQEYLTSDGINETMNVLDPARIAIREKRLNVIESAMKESKENFIKYASKQARVANYYKKWQGELLGLKLNDAVNKKKDFEADFLSWANQDPYRQEQYAGIINEQKVLYKAQENNQLHYTYIREALMAPEFVQIAGIVKTIIDKEDKGEDWDNNAWVKSVYNQLNGMDLYTDKQIAQDLFAMYEAKFEKNNALSVEQINLMYAHSIFKDTVALSKLLRAEDKLTILNTLKADPAYVTFDFIDSKYNALIKELRPSIAKIDENYKTYMQALREYSKEPLFPDANFTLRLTYGKVQGIEPQDGMYYNFYTTLGGAVRKRNTEVEEFNMPQKLVDLYRDKDFGRYAIEHNGKTDVPVCFLASAHTTGGNSGSPVMNAYGELIGTNFDRIWEGTMSDILYDINLCRNITVDIRYTLFIIEKYGEAKWVVDEMDLIETRD
jgi:hypothetical protein